MITDKSYVHPWINAMCLESLQDKHSAIGTDRYPAARDTCPEIFRKTYQDYVIKTRETLKSMDPSSRGWWKVANTLRKPPLMRTSLPSNVLMAIELWCPRNA